MLNKRLFLITNGIAFAIAIMDGYIWRDSVVGFPLMTILGFFVASVAGIIYYAIRTFKTRRGVDIISSLIFIWFTAPMHGIIGGIIGLLAGFTVFKF